MTVLNCWVGDIVTENGYWIPLIVLANMVAALIMGTASKPVETCSALAVATIVLVAAMVPNVTMGVVINPVERVFVFRLLV